MRVAAIQSCYMPWRGYFDFIASVDLFVIYDDVQYSTGSWRNRNQVKTAGGLKWVTIPVSVKSDLAIDEVQIGHSPKPWRNTHRGLLTSSLQTAPYFKDAMSLWEQAVSKEHTHLTPLNVSILRLVCEYLGIKTPLVFSRDYNLSGSKTDRLIDLLKKTKATHYLSGPAAKDYIDEQPFKDNGITLEYKSYNYAPYPQLWGDFSGAVTILDMIANIGPESRNFLRSLTPDTTAAS